MNTSLLTRLIAGTMAVLILLALAGPVQYDKNAQADQQAADDLTEISSQVSNYYSANFQLPQSLDDLDLDAAVLARAQVNPYQYMKQLRLEYQLCANFKTDTVDGRAATTSLPAVPDYFGGTVDTMVHPSGRHCFDFDVSFYGGLRGETVPSEPVDLGDFETELDSLDGLEELLTPENLEAFESFAL